MFGVGIAGVKSKAGLNQTQGAEVSPLGAADQFAMLWNAQATVGRREFSPRTGARVYHPVTFLDGHRQRLFAEHVFSSGGGPYAVFGVLGVWQHHKDRVDLGIVRDAVEVLEGVDALLRHAEFTPPFRALLR